MSEQIRVIKKHKKGGHGGHHGGSWKVAYADFVTAMMAFFLVMWIVGLNQSVKDSVAAYFKDPIGFMQGVEKGKKPFNIETPGALSYPEVTKDIRKDSMNMQQKLDVEKKRFESAKKEIEHTVKSNPKFRKLAESTQVRISHEGLRIDLLESAPEVFFDSGSAMPKPKTRDLLKKIAGTLGRLPNRMIVEGHTDSRPYCGPNGWTNWELSAARANAARAIMESSGIGSSQLLEVRGLADRMLLDPKHPDSFKNRRVSILLPFSVDGPAEVIDMNPSNIAPDIAPNVKKPVHAPSVAAPKDSPHPAEPRTPADFHH